MYDTSEIKKEIYGLVNKFIEKNDNKFLYGDNLNVPEWFLNELKNNPVLSQYASDLQRKIALNVFSENMHKDLNRDLVYFLKIRNLYNIFTVSGKAILKLKDIIEKATNEKNIKQKKVSIIMPVLNKWELTKKALIDIIGKTRYPDWEIIVVDNASTDKTRLMLPEFAEHFKDKVKVIRLKENLGFSEANNRGTEIADGKYLLFLNNDIIVYNEDWIESMAEVLDMHPLISATGQMPNIDIDTPNGLKWIQAILLDHILIPVSWISGYCLMIKREKFSEAGRWRGDIYGKAGWEDIHLGYAVNNAGGLCVSPLRFINMGHIIGQTQKDKDIVKKYKTDDINSEDKYIRFKKYFGKRNYNIPVLNIKQDISC